MSALSSRCACASKSTLSTGPPLSSVAAFCQKGVCPSVCRDDVVNTVSRVAWGSWATDESCSSRPAVLTGKSLETVCLTSERTIPRVSDERRIRRTAASNIPYRSRITWCACICVMVYHNRLRLKRTLDETTSGGRLFLFLSFEPFSISGPAGINREIAILNKLRNELFPGGRGLKTYICKLHLPFVEALLQHRLFQSCPQHS